MSSPPPVVDRAEALPALRLFGTPVLRGDGATLRFAPERRFQLLAVLALADGRWVTRDELGRLLWPSVDAAAARGNLRTVVHRTRELPGLAALEVADHALRWCVDHDVQLLMAAGRIRDAQKRHDALLLAERPLLEGLEDPSNPAWTEWLDTQRHRLQGVWQSTAWSVLEQTVDPAARSDLAERLLCRDPLDETAMTAWLQAALQRGQQAGARQRYQAFVQRLAEELGVEPARHLRDLMAAAGDCGRAGGTSQGIEATRPMPPRPAANAHGFVGRQMELAEARALLSRADCRLLTLLGPGGVGKSRLARVLAGLTQGDIADGDGDFPGGAWWVDLQDLAAAPALLPRLAQLLGLQTLEERSALAQVAAALPPARGLLVLDNAEHLLALPADEGLVPLLRTLLAAHPAICVLVTSRVRLCGSEAADLPEWLLPVPGLAVPDDDSRDAEAAPAFDAVRLFALRAAQADPRFTLAAHIDAVVDIAQAVAGMPLALELAASWVRLMPPAAIADELRNSLDLLQRHPASGGQPARPEHVNVRTVLEQSVALLAPAERQALAEVSVFQDGFTHEAARALGRGTAMPLLSALADKGLLASDADGRFRLHPLVQTLGAERLAQDPAHAAATRLAHARHFARYMAALAPLARGELRRLVTAVDAEFANICRAWETAVEAGRADALGDMVRALWVYFEVTGRLHEGIRRLRPAMPRLVSLAAQEAHDPQAGWALSRLRHGLSMLMHRGGHQAEGLAVAEAGMAAGMQGEDLEAHVGCLLNSGSCLMALGRLDEAHARFGTALALAQARAETHCIAWALGNLAVSHTMRGEAAAAIEHGERALHLDRLQANQYQVAVHLINLGSAQFEAGELGAAIDRTREAVQHTRDHGLLLFELHARSNLANFLLRAGRADEARTLTQQCLRSARTQGLLVVQASQLTVLARMEVQVGRCEAALPHLREAVRLALGHGLQRELSLILRAWAACCEARGEPSAAARVLLCAIRLASTPPADARFYAELLAALPLDAKARSAAALQVPSLDAVLADIEAGRPS